ncbi:MAG: hypothetical protein ACXVXG_15035 [Nocardioidaceae bacterium]
MTGDGPPLPILVVWVVLAVVAIVQRRGKRQSPCPPMRPTGRLGQRQPILGPATGSWVGGCETPVRWSRQLRFRAGAPFAQLAAAPGRANLGALGGRLTGAALPASFAPSSDLRVYPVGGRFRASGGVALQYRDQATFIFWTFTSRRRDSILSVLEAAGFAVDWREQRPSWKRSPSAV